MTPLAIWVPVLVKFREMTWDFPWNACPSEKNPNLLTAGTHGCPSGSSVRLRDLNDHHALILLPVLGGYMGCFHKIGGPCFWVRTIRAFLLLRLCPESMIVRALYYLGSTLGPLIFSNSHANSMPQVRVLIAHRPSCYCFRQQFSCRFLSFRSLRWASRRTLKCPGSLHTQTFQVGMPHVFPQGSLFNHLQEHIRNPI